MRINSNNDLELENLCIEFRRKASDFRYLSPETGWEVYMAAGVWFQVDFYRKIKERDE